MSNEALAQLARRSGGKLLDRAVTELVGGTGKSSIAGKLAGAAITRIAMRSVPGAIVVGGGLLAKVLYDRRRARKARGGNGQG